MSANTLATRSAGQVILDSFFNDLRSALAEDFVGRNVNGVPEAGKNLGSAAYPWGILYATQMVIDGAAFSSSSLERPPYQIVSGKTRSGSNQPLFLSPAGSSPSFSLLASVTNLILSIKGTAVTWTTDKNSIPVTTAPSTQNTCLVNDSTAAGQVATRQWGEYGSGAPYYAITVDTMGTNVSARVGSYQAFKVGTEYFIGYIESSTSISRCFRGFFFNSSGNPVKRTTLSDNDTITLMNLGYVFADADGSTVDTIFVGAGVNNNPSWSYAAPTSPATGDYWYDMGNEVWKTWGGASWSIVSRILVGLVVADSTNCVAARSLDFYGLCRGDNTIDLAYESTSKLKSSGALQRVNVNGALVSFGSGRATWDTASNVAASTDRYNSSVTASTMEYFFVTDDGETKISDIEPYWRADLLGYYHPFNPWRCVGQAAVNSSVQFSSDGIAVFGKRQLPAPGQRFSSGSGLNLQKTNTGGYVDCAGLSISGMPVTGRPVRLFLNAYQYNGYISTTPYSSAETVLIAFLRDGTIIREFNCQFRGNLVLWLPVGAFQHTDFDVTPGIHDYKVQAYVGSGTTLELTYIKFVAREE